MKLVFFFTFWLCLFSQQLDACSCNNIPTLCEEAHKVETNARMLFWIGELINTVQLGNDRFVAKFKVVEVLSGEIILPDSPLAKDNSIYENTTSEIWVFGGSGAECLYESFDSLSLFACSYYDGYIPDICSTSYLSIDDSMNVTGYIYETFVTETVSLEEIRAIIETKCPTIINTNDITELIAKNIYLKSNVINNSLSFEFENQWISDTELRLISSNGTCFQKVDLFYDGSYTLNTSELPSGMYVLQFVSDENQHCIKIMKQ